MVAMEDPCLRESVVIDLRHQMFFTCACDAHEARVCVCVCDSHTLSREPERPG